MKIQENNKWKIVFRIYYKYFKYYIILFKLLNTLIIFQVYIKYILIKFINIYIIYLNNILIYLENLK